MPEEVLVLLPHFHHFHHWLEQTGHLAECLPADAIEPCIKPVPTVDKFQQCFQGVLFDSLSNINQDGKVLLVAPD